MNEIQNVRSVFENRNEEAVLRFSLLSNRVKNIHATGAKLPIKCLNFHIVQL